MADTMEIIISAVDSASEVFQSIISTVTDFGSNVSDVVNTAGAEFDGVAENGLASRYRPERRCGIPAETGSR